MVYVPATSDPEDRLQEAVLSYLQSRDHGQPLDAHTLLERYADISTELQAFLDDEAQLNLVLSPLRAASASSQSSLAGPREFGRYELLAEIGRGGMGIVYKARQQDVGRLVALKIMRSGSLSSVAELERFRNETRTIAGLDHPHIVPVYDVGDHEGQLFYTMPLLEGGTLVGHLPQLYDDPRQATLLVAAVARAVHHAHQRGVLHRDIKLSNILLDREGRSFVSDFGLAKRLDYEQSLTESGAVIGTPGYLSPEQASGRIQEITTASDVYGLGAVLYAILAGRPPCHGSTLLETLTNVRDREPESLAGQNPLVDCDLSAICLKCLEKSPNRRYSSAEALADDLDRWLAGIPVQARAVGRAGRAWRWCRRNPLIASLATATTMLLLAGIVGLIASLITVRRAWEETERQRSLAVQNAALLRRQLYAAQIPIAYQHWERGEIDELSTLLKGHAPTAEQEDLRGFEWRYLNALVQRQPLRRRTYHAGSHSVYHAAFSPDGKHVATAAADRSVRMWDEASGALLGTQDGLAGDGNCVTFYPDGDKLISACEDGTLRLWDLRTLAWELLPFRCEGEIFSVQISPDGTRLVTAGQEPFVRVRSVGDWAIEVELARPGPTSMAMFAPDGKRLMTVGKAAEQSLVEVWELADMQQPRCAIQRPIATYTAAFSPNGAVLATGDEGGTVSLWESATGRHLDDLGQHFNHCRSVCFSPDGQLLASAGHDGRIRIWSLADHRSIAHYKAHAGRIWSLGFSADGRGLLSSGADGAARWEIPSGPRPESSLAVASGAAHRVLFTPRDAELAVLTSDGRVSVGAWTAASPLASLPITTMTGPNAAAELSFLPDGKSFVYAASDGTIRLWRWAAKREQVLQPVIEEPAASRDLDPVIPMQLHGCTLTPDGNFLAAGYQRGWVKVWTLPEMTQVFQDCVPWPHGKILAASPNSRTLVVQPTPNSVRFLDLTAGRWVGNERHYPTPITTLSFAPDGESLALGHVDGSLHIIDASTAEPRLRLSGHLGKVHAVCYSPDGMRLATSSSDASLRLWDLAAGGQELLVIANPQRRIRALAFSPDGNILAAGGEPDPSGHNVWLANGNP